jgi:hypothetical protein
MEDAMWSLNTGRFTVGADHEVTVFLIGMRLNKPLRVDKWWPVVTAMPRMLKHLSQDQDAGMLGFASWFGRTTVLVSYWSSPHHLQRFAAATEAPHLAAWRSFNKHVGNDGSVGIWHETYVVPASSREVVYVNMPAFGLGKALGVRPVGPGAHTAKQRLTRSQAA